MRKVILLFFFIIPTAAIAEDGYRLWLRYDRVKDEARLSTYRGLIKGWMIDGSSPTLDAAAKELSMGLSGLLGTQLSASNRLHFDGILCAKLTSSLLNGATVEVPGATGE